MYTYRTLSLVISALLLLLAFSSCSQKGDFTAADISEPSFELNVEERAALAINDDSSLTVDFGDPSLGTASFEAPPGGDALAKLLGTQLPSTVRTTSSGDKKSDKKKKKHKKGEDCGCDEPEPCLKVTGICNLTERFWKVGDCCAKTSEVQYEAQVEFDQETGDKSGVEVIFKRDGTEVGRALTDADGLATFTETGVTRGNHTITTCVAEDAVTCEEDQGSECSGKVNSLTLKYLGTTAGTITVVGTKSGTSYFSGTVQPGGTFSFAAPAGESFGTNIDFTLNGQYLQSIHTSCSQPIGIGMTWGSFLILDGSSLVGGKLPQMPGTTGGTDTKKSKSTSSKKDDPMDSPVTPLPTDGSCITDNPNYAPKLQGTELVVGKPSGPSNGPVVTEPNKPLTFTAIYHDEWAIDTAPYGPSYTITGSNGQTFATGVPTVGTAPVGAGDGLHETQFLSLLTINLPQGLPAGNFQIALKAYDGDQNHRGGDWGVVTWTVTNPCGTPPPPPCNCGGEEFKCNTCSSTANDGFYCSTLDFAVYTDCIKGAVTGTGYFPSCNPLRVGMRNGMNFRAAYDNGAVQGYLNYWDGGLRITNGQIKWLLISGVHSWFGGDGWMVHVYDGGKSFNLDSFEIWIEDPATCTCYHCGGYLTGCYVNVSYKYSQVCP